MKTTATAIAIALAACTGSADDPGAAPSPSASFDPAAALAQLDGQPDQASGYASLLASLDDDCTEDRADIADIAVVTRDVLEGEGTTLSYRDVLLGIRESLPPDAPVLECDEVAAGWATVLIHGG